MKVGKSDGCGGRGGGQVYDQGGWVHQPQYPPG